VIEFSTSVFRSASNGDPKKIRKIDRIKQKLVEMLRESFHHMERVFNQLTTIYTGEIGFKLSNVGSRGPPSMETWGEKDT
jgi:hypothetical protein